VPEYGTVSAASKPSVPGVSIAWHVAGRAQHLCAGTDERGAEPITASTLFQAGSTSKLVAAITALTLVGDGTLPWDEPLLDLIPNWQPARRPRRGHDVTIERILGHRSGATVHGYLGTHPDLPRPSTLDSLADVTFDEPGEFAYSGGGYQVLQLAVETVTGRPFANVAGERVLRRCGASTATYDTPPVAAPGVTGGSVDGVGLAHRWQVMSESAAAGLWATAGDIAALFAAFTAAVRGERADLLPQSLAERIVTPTGAIDEKGDAVGHGCFLDASPARTWCAHDGRNIGYCSVNRWHLDGSLGVAVLTNGLPDGTALGRQLIAAIEADPSGARALQLLTDAGLH
jgi:CubicO group peptidase (beta-lactamase class C family)